MRGERDSIASRWLDGMTQAGFDAASSELPERVTSLIAALADVIADPDDAGAKGVLRDRAVPLAELRFEHGFDVGEFLHDVHRLGDELSESAYALIQSGDGHPAGDAYALARDIFSALFIVEHVAAQRYSRIQGERVGERDERLRMVRRTITHELKNRVGATLGAGQLLREEWLGNTERIRFAGMVEENSRAIQVAVENLTALTRASTERRRRRTIPLRQAVGDVFDELRELAKARAVDLRIDEPLPEVEVNASAFEVSLAAYLSNSLKFADAQESQRWAEVSASLEESRETSEDGEQLVVRVRDNGAGVATDVRERLFERFQRGREGAAGAGLGLSQVRETVQSLGGRAWAELDQERGSVFAFSLPTAASGAKVSGNVAATRVARPRQDPARATAYDSPP